MIPFRERNPVTIGAVGLTTIAVLLAGAFNIKDLPLIGNGDEYTAAFSEAGGLKPGDEVRIAGVKVGKVDEVTLEDGHVKVAFNVDDAELGDRTGAAIRVKTILGAKYLALRPEGGGELGGEIPLSRTESAYDVVEAFSDLATTTEKVDTEKLAESLDTISETFADSPEEVKASIRGLSKISRTVASRDRELRQLLKHADGVTKVLSDRSDEFGKLVKDGDALFKEIDRRRQVIHRLLRSSIALATQLSGLVGDNRQQIGPALKRLDTVVDMLRRNQESIDRSVALLAPYARLFTNTLGNGRWFDSYIQNLVVPGPVTPQSGAVPKTPGGSR